MLSVLSLPTVDGSVKFNTQMTSRMTCTCTVAVLGFAVWGATGVTMFSSGGSQNYYTIAVTDPGFGRGGSSGGLGNEVPQKQKRFH